MELVICMVIVTRMTRMGGMRGIVAVSFVGLMDRQFLLAMEEVVVI